MTTVATPPRPAPTRWVRLSAHATTQPTVARERAGGYDPGGNGHDDHGADREASHHDPDRHAVDGAPEGRDTGHGPGADQGEVGDSAPADVRDAARALQTAARHLVGLVADEGRVEGGELGALRDTLAALDVAQAAAVGLTGQVQRRGAAERSAGLPLEHLLALETRLTGGDRRMLTSTAETLRGMPHLTRAFQAGLIGWAEVRSIVCEVRGLPVADRARLDAGFADLSLLRGRDADRLLDEVRAAAEALRPEQAARNTARTIERRFLALQPMLDGTGGSGYFELDDEAFATVAAGLEAAMPPPSAGPRDVTRDALGHADETGDGDAGPNEHETADGDPAFCDPLAGHRSRARQRADALVLLAETYLSGTRADGTVRRARPLMLVACELDDLAHDGAPSHTARLLTALPGSRPAITHEALTRLASDADLQLVIKDHGQIVGVSAPTATIPARVRAAVAARDQGCRFPGCRMPIQFTDCHHVTPREDEGPTIISNLVALCRRHHTAITDRHWHLTMTPDGVVTVRRGRRTATSDPPATTPFRGPPRQPPGRRPPTPPTPTSPAPGPQGLDPPGPPSGSDPPG